MSTRTSHTLLCPDCQHEQEVELYDSINVTEDPSLKEALLANQINAVTCSSCEFVFRVDKHLLYHDQEIGLMISLLPGSPEEQVETREGFLELLQSVSGTLPDDFDPPELQVVHDRVELVERIFIRDAGLNERIIEYIKYLTYTRNLDQFMPEAKRMLFNAQDSTDEQLCFVVQDLESGQLEQAFVFERSAYQGIEEMFENDENTAMIFEIFPGPYISARHYLMSDLEDVPPPAPENG